jgi:hypothetical protein
LIELVVREVTESSNPTVSALARGAFPMASEVKKGLMCAVAISGVAVMTGLGLAISPLASSEKKAQPTTNNRVSSDPPTTVPRKAPEESCLRMLRCYVETLMALEAG